jgi:hypothetical protein
MASVKSQKGGVEHIEDHGHVTLKEYTKNVNAKCASPYVSFLAGSLANEQSGSSTR